MPPSAAAPAVAVVMVSAIALGLEYYLQQDMPHGVPVPRELFVAATVPQSSQVNPPACRRPAACLGDEPRIWTVGSGSLKDPFHAIPGD